jgi:hypothetical protein
MEQSVNNIISGIHRIVFNKWVMFTHHEVKYNTQPRLMGAQKLLNSMNNLFVQKKVLAIKLIHLYSLSIAQN